MHPGFKPMEAASTACLLDAARVEGLLAILRSLGVEPRPLYTGPSAGQLAAVAPYLVPCSAGSPFNQWFFQTGWGRGLGVAVVSPASMEELYSHFRQFLLVLDEAGKRLYFRFYDPRVLRIFLPTCDADQLRSFFGPVSAFLVEDEEPRRALRFALAGGDLVTETIELSREPAAALPELPSPAQPEVGWKGSR